MPCTRPEYMICIRLRFKVLTRRQCATFNLLPGEKSPFAGFDSEDKAITPAPGAMFFVRGAPGGRRRTALSPRGPGQLIRLLDEPLCGAGFFGGGVYRWAWVERGCRGLLRPVRRT